jgi:hypothetical protein
VASKAEDGYPSSRKLSATNRGKRGRRELRD